MCVTLHLSPLVLFGIFPHYLEAFPRGGKALLSRGCSLLPEQLDTITKLCCFPSSIPFLIRGRSFDMVPVRTALARWYCQIPPPGTGEELSLHFAAIALFSFPCSPLVRVALWPHQPPGTLPLLWLQEAWFAGLGFCKLLLWPALFVFVCDLPDLRNISIFLIRIQLQLLRGWLIDFNNAFYPAVLVCWLPLCSPYSQLPKSVCFPSFHAACKNFALLTSHLGVCCICSV